MGRIKRGKEVKELRFKVVNESYGVDRLLVQGRKENRNYEQCKLLKKNSRIV